MSEIMAGDKAIGGYFELGLPKSNSENPHKNAIKFQSARAAFRALLKQKKPTKVWMPKYICNAMIQPLLDESVDVGWYDLDGEFCVEDNLLLGETEWLLYVNYFGLFETVAEKVLRRFPPAHVVLDYSQAFYSDAKLDALATIYSPRKYFGVPDGGLLVTKLAIREPVENDDLSLLRMTHLLKRIYASP